MLLQTPQRSIHHTDYSLSFSMFDDRKFSWSSAFVGAAAATATALVISSRRRDPATSHLISVDLTSFKFNFPTLDAEMNLTVNVTNPNLAPIGSPSSPVIQLQPRQLFRLPVIKLTETQFANAAKKFVAEIGRRRMVLDSTLSVSGAAKVMWWNQRFKVNVDSHVDMDPFSLGDQGNRPKFKILVKS